MKQALAAANAKQQLELNELLNELTKFTQKRQRETGRSFVSRTRLNPAQWSRMNTIVFRVVLANPLTSLDILASVLEEQRNIIVHQAPNLLAKINKLADGILTSTQSS